MRDYYWYFRLCVQFEVGQTHMLSQLWLKKGTNSVLPLLVLYPKIEVIWKLSLQLFLHKMDWKLKMFLTVKDALESLSRYFYSVFT